MESITEKCIAFVKLQLKNAEGGHDWFHVERVWRNAQAIAATEECDRLVVELAALLHDVADSKFHQGDEELGPTLAGHFLREQSLPAAQIEHIQQIIRHVSYKGGHGNASGFQSQELKIVQDADRLDALGAIGIARTFNYGGFKNRPIYDPAVPPNLNMTREQYKSNAGPSINHFYEKLLRLKDGMHTRKGRELAEGRHRLMEQFLDAFFKECQGLQ